MTNTDMIDPAIRPFRIDVPETELADLDDRPARTRLPEPVAGCAAGDWSRGIAPGYLAELAQYWRDTFDWRAQEAKLNEIPQFTTGIDGQRIHFFHLRSPEPDAIALLITHGYPGSALEFVDLLGPLTDPAAHGGNPRDAFHVVLPSLPGFGFSTPLGGAGWEIGRTTAAWAELMTRLGYHRFAAQGGDIGSGITGRLGAILPDRLIGAHINSDRGGLGLVGDRLPMPADLTAEEHAVLAEARDRWSQERGYLLLQSHRPNAIAAAITDSPVAQLAWIAEKFQTWTDPARSAAESVDRDALLTLISVYWFTRAGATAAQFLYEAEHSGLDWLAPSTVPAGWAVFNSHPLMRRVMDPHKRMAHFREYAVGGHFPAMEQPGLFVSDVRDFFRGLRG